MNKRQIMGDVKLALAIGGLAAVMLLSSGCGTTQPKLAIDPVPDGLIYTETVDFEQNLAVPLNAQVRDPDDPRQLVLLALTLSERGRHLNAAEFFLEAAERFDSRQNEFELTCLAAAANELLKAGEMDKFRETVWKLRRTANRYQLATMDGPMNGLLCLGDIANGATRPSERTPKELKALYQGNE